MGSRSKKKTDYTVKPLAERVYRLMLLDGLMRGVKVGVGNRASEIGNRGRGAEVGSRAEIEKPLSDGRVVVEDLIRLSRELPYPGSVEEFEGLAPVVREVLGRCESEVGRGLLPGSVGLIMLWAFELSRRPYVPTLDELVLI